MPASGSTGKANFVAFSPSNQSNLLYSGTQKQQSLPRISNAGGQAGIKQLAKMSVHQAAPGQSKPMQAMGLNGYVLQGQQQPKFIVQGPNSNSQQQYRAPPVGGDNYAYYNYAAQNGAAAPAMSSVGRTGGKLAHFNPSAGKKAKSVKQQFGGSKGHTVQSGSKVQPVGG